MSKEFYKAVKNLHMQEFGCLVYKDQVVIVDGDKTWSRALEGTVSNAFRIFVRNGLLVKISESEARKLDDSYVPPAPKKKEPKKMNVVDGDESKIEIRKIDTRSDDQRIIDQDNGLEAGGMKVEVKETIDIGAKVKDIPNESEEVKTKNGISPRNKVHEKTAVDKEAVQKRREERIKAAEAIEKETKAKESGAQETEKKTESKPKSEPAKQTAKTTETKKAEGKSSVKKEEVAEKTESIPITPSSDTSVKSGKAKTEFSEIAETIKLE